MIFILEGESMKRVIIIVALTLFTLQLYAQESYWQVAQRAKYYGDEWNDLNKIQDELQGDAIIRLYAYKLGYAQAAQYICEGLRNVGMREFAYSTNFFFEQIKVFEDIFTKRDLWLDLYNDWGKYTKYYRAGEDRIIKQTRRYTASDFR
jgi:uncharacterized membrane protein YjgN (DUF898 family)